MIENLTIFTGPQDEVQSEARDFLAAHPNARVLATAITFMPGPLLELPPLNAASIGTDSITRTPGDKDTTAAAGDTAGASGDAAGKAVKAGKPGNAGAATGTTTANAAPDADKKEDAPPEATALLAQVQHGPGEIIVSLTLGNVFP